MPPADREFTNAIAVRVAGNYGRRRRVAKREVMVKRARVVGVGMMVRVAGMSVIGAAIRMSGSTLRY